MCKQKIADFFDAKSKTWDSNEKPHVKDIVKTIVNKIAPAPGSKILDIGCGTGILYPFLQEFKPAETLHIDISPGMLGEFAKKHPAANLLLGDFEETELEKDYFDYIIAYNVYPHFTDKNKVFSNAMGSLKKGGWFYIVHSMTREELKRVHSSNEQTQRDLLPPASEMAGLYQNAGFQNVSVEEQAPGFFACGQK